ncbi:MAG TPA: cation diffusion facilitator family transporter [Bryobacteraceae bacterium]|nr:cation diffusion facilitator family transporter [Bryobacteraceae bacterium]
MANDRIEAGRRLAIISVLVSAALALANVTIGLLSRSTSVTAAGLEFAGDVLASLIVFLGMLAASRPADEDHPYGHGRFETLAGLLVGLILAAAGIGICAHSLYRLTEQHPPPGVLAVWALACSMVVKGVLAWSKFRVGRSIGSTALVADAWNDSVDLLSALAALGAVVLTRVDPERFAAADHYGGVAVGLVVILTGLRVARDSSLELTDKMPAPAMLASIRQLAIEVPRVENVEKCFARKTGLQYHVDLHIEVNPELTVAESHYIAHQVQEHIVRGLPSVADVLIHIEPAPQGRFESEGSD